MANKIVRIILILVIFFIFFEVGLFSSYTIVTAEPPNIQGLIDMQISKVSDIFSPKNVNDALIKDPTSINISNKKDVALKMEGLSQVDGVNVDSMNITTFDDPNSGNNITVTIEALVRILLIKWLLKVQRKIRKTDWWLMKIRLLLIPF